MARFLLVVGHQLRGRLAPAWPGAGRPDRLGPKDGPWVAWRLLGSNNRELARSASVSATAEDAIRRVRELRSVVDRAVASTDVARGLWTWELSVDGIAVAVASRLYHRPRECAYNLAAALAAIPVAEIADALPRVARPGEPSWPPALDRT